MPSAYRRSWPAGQGVAPFGDRRINARSRLPHAYRSYATSFIGTQRRGIHHLLIVSSLKEDLEWTIYSVADKKTHWQASRDACRTFDLPLHLVRYTASGTSFLAPLHRGPSPLNRDDAVVPILSLNLAG